MYWLDEAEDDDLLGVDHLDSYKPFQNDTESFNKMIVDGDYGEYGISIPNNPDWYLSMQEIGGEYRFYLMSDRHGYISEVDKRIQDKHIAITFFEQGYLMFRDNFNDLVFPKDIPVFFNVVNKLQRRVISKVWKGR